MVAAEVIHSDSNKQLIDTLRRSKLFRRYEQVFSDATGLSLALRPVDFWQLEHDGKKHQNRFCAMLAERPATLTADTLGDTIALGVTPVIASQVPSYMRDEASGVRVVKNTDLSGIRSGTPGPLSSTAISTSLSSWLKRTATREPCLRALSIRLANTRRSPARLTLTGT